MSGQSLLLHKPCNTQYIYIYTYTVWRQVFEEHNFHVFANELRTVKLHSAKIWQYSQLKHSWQIRYHTAGSMALFCYFSKASKVEKVPDPHGALAKDIPSSAISSAKTEVQQVLQFKVDPLTLACYLRVRTQLCHLDTEIESRPLIIVLGT